VLIGRNASDAIDLHQRYRLDPCERGSDGDLHRYFAEEDGTRVRFWLYKKPDGNVVAVFDACTICGALGFKKDGHGFVCKNCSAPINPQTVGTPGGCNPIPLKATITATPW